MLSSFFSRKLSAASMDVGIAQLTKDIYWIGTNDWDLREFHSMHAPVGTSYNSYLIQCDQPTVIDCVKSPFYNQWVSRLQTVFGEDLRGLKHIVLQHAEPDHTSAMQQFMQQFPHVQLLCTEANFKTLSRFYNTKKWNKKIVKLGTPINLGNKQIIMAGVPLAHWPEQAVTYVPDEKVLFSSDAFGQHIASSKRFMDEIDSCLYHAELKSYFSNILMRLWKPVLKAMDTAGKLPGINMLLPAHGVGYRRPEDIAHVLDIYRRYCLQIPEKKLTVLYDCNWFGTEKMAVAIASGAASVGVDVKCCHARHTHITNVATEMIDSAGIAVGSPVLHESILPDLACHLSYLKCLNVRNKVGAIFGNYGWTKNAVQKEIRQQLFTPCKVKEVAEPVMGLWNPVEEDFRRCEELGRKLGEAVIENVNNYPKNK